MAWQRQNLRFQITQNNWQDTPKSFFINCQYFKNKRLTVRITILKLLNLPNNFNYIIYIFIINCHKKIHNKEKNNKI
jgi:hypothetical protein